MRKRMATSIRDNIPKKPKEVVNVQARIDKELVDQVRSLLKNEGLDWKDLIQASFITYIQESKARKSA